MSIENLYKVFLASSGVCTDTRNITPNCIFFALKGEHFNGNHYAHEALEKGAGHAVVDESISPADDCFILAADVLTTLQELASWHRNQLGIPILAITGSNGKTTTKELIKAVLSKKFNVLATAGNFNNHIGVPLTLLKLTSETEFGIIEMGANHIGEIAVLCDIAQPNFGLITNIGRAHLEGFGSIEGVLRGKSELYHYLISHNGTVFINSKNEMLMNMSKRFKQPVFYPAVDDNYYCEFVSADPFVKVNTSSGRAINTKLIGDYNFENIAAALCIGAYFDVQESAMIEAIDQYIPTNNRSEIVNTKSNLIVLDAYNANPNSMKAALLNFNEMKAEKKAVNLGDMFELGQESENEHAKIGELLAAMNINEVIVCGDASQAIVENYPHAIHFENKEALIEHLQQHKIEDASILIKASRGMGLETLVPFL